MLKNILFLVFLLFATKQTLAQDPVLTTNLQTIATQEQMAGMSVIAIRADSVVYEGYFGQRDITRSLAINANTRYRIASISKTFSAIALMKLYEQNLFQLDDDVNSYLGFNLRNPNFPADKITFRMLLSHTSSVQDGTGYNGFLSATFSSGTIPPISQLLVPGGANYTTNMFRTEKPGTYFNYSNIQFGIIGTLVEKISNQRFDIYIKQNILTPLGIQGSFNIDDLSSSINDVATLYRKSGTAWAAQLDNYAGIAPTPNNYSGYTIGSNGLLFGPQGNLRATAKELASMISMISKNGIAPNGNRILNDSTVRLMRKAQYTYTTTTSGNNYYGLFRSWGLGLQISTANATNDQVFAGKTMWGHAGEAYGLVSDAYIDTTTKTGVIFITNGKFGSYTSCNSQFYCVEEKVFNAVNTYLNLLLPVKFTSFNAHYNNNKVILQFTTESEVNNKGFDVEKSLNGIDFKTIGYVVAKEKNALNKYEFTDDIIEKATTYYRLKQIDISGKYSYSNTIVLNNKANSFELKSLAPNPSTNNLTININASKAKKIVAIVTDITGKMLMQTHLNITIGSNTFSFKTTHLQNGSYILKLNDVAANEAIISSFIKQ